MHFGRSLLLLAGAALAWPCSIEAQVDPPRVQAIAAAELAATVALLDSALFAAFNAHVADRLGSFFTPDLEFYHDKTGLAGYGSTMANFRCIFTCNASTSRFFEHYLNNSDEVKDPKDLRIELNCVIDVG
jgi:hypothetical protein